MSERKCECNTAVSGLADTVEDLKSQLLKAHQALRHAGWQWVISKGWQPKTHTAAK